MKKGIDHGWANGFATGNGEKGLTGLARTALSRGGYGRILRLALECGLYEGPRSAGAALLNLYTRLGLDSALAALQETGLIR
ncbi:MAG: hypothetical protein H6656_20085 [Ardenticatenaceae bacterium]|nr:hypothetical protein [Ardenticatenaceae bacterium]